MLIFFLSQAISSMIETIIEDFAQILIVKFDLNPAQLHPSQYGTLAELDSTRARQEAVQSLKTITTGQHTCIGKKYYNLSGCLQHAQIQKLIRLYLHATGCILLDLLTYIKRSLPMVDECPFQFQLVAHFRICCRN